MSRRTLAITVLCFAGILALTTFSGWLLNTTTGAVWLFESAASVAGVQMTAGHIEGRLSDELQVADLVFAWQDGKLTINKVKLDWEPLSALHGKLKINLLEVDHCVVESFSTDDNAGAVNQAGQDDKDIGFSAGDLSFLPTWLALDIADLQFKDLILQTSDDSVTVFDSLAGVFVYSSQQLRSSAFSYLSPFVDLAGHFDWDLSVPHLEMVADVHLPEALIDHQLFEDIDVPVDFPGELSLDGDWNSFSGPVRFGTETEARSKVWLSADAKGSWQGIYFNNLEAYYLGGRLDGDLDLEWIDSFRMHGQLKGVDLNPGLFLNDLDGLATLNVSGELLVPYDESSLNAHIDGQILEGQLRGADVFGDVSLDWQQGDLYEIEVDLKSAESTWLSGESRNSVLILMLSIADLSSLYAELSGELSSSGWLRWADGYLSGELSRLRFRCCLAGDLAAKF